MAEFWDHILAVIISIVKATLATLVQPHQDHFVSKQVVEPYFSSASLSWMGY